MDAETMRRRAGELVPMFAEVGGGLRMGMREEYADALEAILRAVAVGATGECVVLAESEAIVTRRDEADLWAEGKSVLVIGENDGSAV